MPEYYYTNAPTSEHEDRHFTTVFMGKTLAFDTDAGVFSKQHVDPGSELLCKSLPELYGRVLDMGCGTGAMTRYLDAHGYDMTGIDLSEEMLTIAKEKSSPDILYLLQDMREFELYGTMRAAVSVCDSMNYILEEEDLLQVFSLVNNYLDPGGIFVFDLNTVYKYQEILGEQTIAEDREECSFIWDNFYDEEEMINEYDLTIFVQEDGELFRRYCETHYQRAYSLETVKTLIEKAGMEVLAIYDAFTYNKPKPDSERVYFVAREHGKKTV